MREEIKTARLLLRRFRESDYDDLFEFLSQLEDDEFEGCPGLGIPEYGVQCGLFLYEIYQYRLPVHCCCERHEKSEGVS